MQALFALTLQSVSTVYRGSLLKAVYKIILQKIG